MQNKNGISATLWTWELEFLEMYSDLFGAFTGPSLLCVYALLMILSILDTAKTPTIVEALRAPCDSLDSKKHIGDIPVLVVVGERLVSCSTAFLYTLP